MPDNENAAASALLSEIAEEERLLDALYREAARRFGLPDCAMWVLYFLAISEEPVTQQGLCGLMMYPKQTVNSSVAKLAGQGLVELTAISGLLEQVGKLFELIVLLNVGQQRSTL